MEAVCVKVIKCTTYSVYRLGLQLVLDHQQLKIDAARSALIRFPVFDDYISIQYLTVPELFSDIVHLTFY